MRSKGKSILIMLFFTVMTFCLLSFPQNALYFSLEALNLWFHKMIPALFPFMVLSGVLIRMDLSDRFAAFFSPLLKPLFSLRSSCLYCIVTGFLCGFPMGARVCAESLAHKKITEQEAQLLLGFCNNIGPIYVTGYVLSLFPTEKKAAVLAGMYGIPLLYGIFLRYTKYRSLSYSGQKSDYALHTLPLSAALNQSILAAMDSITVLGGYMIFCNLLNLIPSLMLKNDFFLELIGGMLEITSGLSRISKVPSWMVYPLLTFGGLSCIAQTLSCMKDTGLSLKRYVFDKTVQTLICMVYFWYILS